ncbi:helix-turn-helix transcriptional regulator [Caldivirga maquilingensis]|uniref:Transcriptional regulator, TrmB n=1 Tax=Caldivirga maquilingensis (strain ATCC 700844 / DSM 13496 / JCM 10307 / IC-167) TaxID=397948 RepID=A8MA98_CALMQ|nr:helix-turn-helix domain-containing protein [Caldivirga maquilingensis]ABW01030.1 transcriptional regulator, TrmB [Caldivirga maquilingensis IC-167]
MQPPLGNVIMVIVMMEAFLIMVLGYMMYDVKARLTKGILRVINDSIELDSLPINDSRPRLNTDEVKVLKYLMSRGKPVIQSIIGKELNIPKSTLFRIIKRLSELGLVNVEKRGKYNYVYIQRTQDVLSILKSINEDSPQN